jgi:hypothetical protein
MKRDADTLACRSGTEHHSVLDISAANSCPRYDRQSQSPVAQANCIDDDDGLPVEG